jgi:two-component system, OmpR family, sensor histidine kinase KdpD
VFRLTTDLSLGVTMSQLPPLPWFLLQKEHNLRWYVQESILVFSSVSGLTLLIYVLQLPTHISNSLLLYLVLILVFAALRGLYDALLASILAFFLFDFFFIPPARSLQASKFEDIIELLIFLFSAILTSYLASALRRQIEQGRQRERHARLLYQLAQALNRQETLEKQLALFAGYFTEVFASLGLRECFFLLPEPMNEYAIVSACPDLSQKIRFLPDEENALLWVHQQQRGMTLYEPQITLARPFIHRRGFFQRQPHYASFCTHLIPLKVGNRLRGILRLRLYINTPDIQGQFWSTCENPSSPSQVFFSTLLEHAITVIQQEELRQERVQLQIGQQTEKLRSALLTSVSHDLRRPLTTIKGATESLLLLQTERSEIEQGFLASIKRETDWLDGLIENLLDMSRIEAGALQLQTVWYAFDVLIYDVLLRMQPIIKQRKVLVEVPDKMPLVAIDVVLIDQVLTNLLTNALCYTPPTTDVSIQVMVEEFRLLIRIVDRGPGIAETDREHIFEKFYRCTSTVREKISGLGLGLSICRGIIDAHHGHIWVEENSNGGAIFAFTLPYAPLEGNSINE